MEDLLKGLERLGLFPETVQKLLDLLNEGLLLQALAIPTLAQILVIGAAFAAAHATTGYSRRLLERLLTGRQIEPRFDRLCRTAVLFPGPLVWLALLWTSNHVALRMGWDHFFIELAASLLSAWIVIRLFSSLIRNPTLSRLFAGVAWTIAALNIVNLIDPAILFLDGMAIQVGGLRVSALLVIKGILTLVVVLWGAAVLASLIQKQLNKSASLSGSLQVVLGKILRLVLLVAAVLVALGYVGIDLTAFAVFSGALGVAIGIGLQKVFANLTSGFTLLLDGSIQPGGVIEVGDTFGRITALKARYVGVETPDGREFLIPNENLITSPVINWSYSAKKVRQQATIGVSYASDVEKAMALVREAAESAERVLANPPPVVFLNDFGSSSVDLLLRYWIDDPMNGLENVRGDILLGVWRRFHEQGIEIPFPQRDLHIRSASGLKDLSLIAARDETEKTGEDD